MHKRIRQFFFPSLTPKYLIRVGLVAFCAYFVFGYVFTPFLIKGRSMEPTYRNNGFNFCFKLRYLFSGPNRFDVVAVRFAGNRVMLLKRVIALEGEQVEFRNGKLFVDQRGVEEPYVRFPCQWSLAPRRVEKGSVYVAGDNRNMPIEQHVFGQTAMSRIVGAPLW